MQVTVKTERQTAVLAPCEVIKIKASMGQVEKKPSKNIFHFLLYIFQTCYVIYSDLFSGVKIENFFRKVLIFQIFLLKTLIVGCTLGPPHNLYVLEQK